MSDAPSSDPVAAKDLASLALADVETRHFRLFSNGKDPWIDRLAIVMQVLKEMEGNEREAAIRYMADYYGYRIYRK